MWQFIVVYIIGILIASLLLYRTWRFFFLKKARPNPCGGCTGCALSQLK